MNKIRDLGRSKLWTTVSRKPRTIAKELEVSLKRKQVIVVGNSSYFGSSNLGRLCGAWEEEKKSSVTAGNDHQRMEYS